MEPLLIYVLLGLACVLLLVNLALYLRLRRLIQAHTGPGDRQADALRTLSTEIGALCSGASGMSEHLGRVEQQLRRLQERQEQLEMRDPVNREYHQAIKLIRNGAGIEELIEHCGLVRAEAELLMRLHGTPHEDDASRRPVTSV